MDNKIEQNFSYAFLATASLFILIFLSHALKISPIVSTVMAASVIFFQILCPLEILKWQGINPQNLNIYGRRIEILPDIFFPPLTKKTLPDFRGLLLDLRFFLVFSAIIFLPYVLVYIAYHNVIAALGDKIVQFSFNLPPRLPVEILTQIFVVALPEELFYRGYLQGTLLKRWPNHHFIFGLPVGKAVIITNLIFACAHLLGTWSILRLLTFFPGMLFSYLVYKNKNLVSAILFHATCNIVSMILYGSVYIR